MKREAKMWAVERTDKQTNHVTINEASVFVLGSIAMDNAIYLNSRQGDYASFRAVQVTVTWDVKAEAEP